ncbi:MAG: metal ABC transporter permease [Synechococcales bacterium]|nr:metal ABC transporter permease [Synechococcales bacterium]
MSLPPDLLRVIELFQFPFMQRALVGGVLTGLMGGLLGSFTILRQLSFFSEALGDAALLGISLGLVVGLNSSLVLLPFAVVFGVVFAYLSEHSKLWTDALLNILCSASIALSIVILSLTGQYKGSIDSLLFGDILAVQNTDLLLSGGLLCVCVVFIGLTLRTQMMLTLDEPMAIARGVPVTAHRTAFIVLLSLVVGVSIKAIGVLLVSAFIVIPACAARLLSRNFTTHVLLSAGLGAVSAVLGIVLSAFLNLPSGPSIVIMQLAIFVGTLWLGRGGSSGAKLLS